MEMSVRRTLVPALVLALAVVASPRAQQSGGSTPAPPPKPSAQPPAAGQQPTPAGQAPPAEQPTPKPTFRTGINFVRVDVIATDKKGNAVTDLKQSDFEVTEDGAPQTVEQFKLIKADGTPKPGEEAPREIRSQFDEESEAQRDDVRMFVIFFDDYHVRLGSSLAVRQPLANFINSLGPNDLVAVMYPLSPLETVQFTRDHEAVARAAMKFEGRKFDYRPRNDLEERYSNYPAEVVERIRTQVSLSAIRGLSTRLGGLREGRKAVILVSEGYTYMLPPQKRDPVASMPGVGNPSRNDPFAGEGQFEQTAAWQADADLQSDLREVYNAANRNNTALYTLDPRGLSTGEFDISENVNFTTDQRYLNATLDTLRTLAEQTDGRAIVNRNDLEKGLHQAVRDSSAYYLLGYNSSRAPQDGKFHEIKVRVKRPGIDVRARRGYWAFTAEDAKRALAPPKPAPPSAVTNALASVAEPTRGRYIRSWIGTARGEDGKTRITYVWEPMPAVPGVAREVPARVSLTASAEDHPVFRGAVPDVRLADAAGAAHAVGSNGGTAAAVEGPSQVTFEAPPGKLEMRIAVENRRGVLDTELRDIVVPDLTAPQVAMSTPRVLRARSAREFQQISRDPDTVPAASREFSRTDRLLIRFDAYGPGSSVPVATAKLLNRAGQRMADIPVTAAPQSGQPSQIDLPLASLAPGEYLIEITAKGDPGGEAKELIPLKVTG